MLNASLFRWPKLQHTWLRRISSLLLPFALFATGLSTVNTRAQSPETDTTSVFRKDNLTAWCIVPYDSKKRTPAERAAMLSRLGFRHFAYDYRAEHVPTFDEEITQLKKHGIELTAWWFPTELNDEARMLLELFKRHNVKPQLWVMGGGTATNTQAEQEARVASEAGRIRAIAEAAADIGCTVGLYNHGGWFGKPENQIAIINHLKMPNVGIVYNLHHGHDDLDRVADLLGKMKPYLLSLNLNGMVPGGDKTGSKIMPIGAGTLDRSLVNAIIASEYTGPIGILNHTDHDAEARLKDNLEGLQWLVDPKSNQANYPVYRTWNHDVPESIE